MNFRKAGYRKAKDKGGHGLLQKALLFVLIVAALFLIVRPDVAHTQEETDAATPIQGAVSVEYYVLIDEQWSLVRTEYEAPREAVGGKLRYYATPEKLAEVYGSFGFDAETYNGERIFPHTDRVGYDTIWADVAPKQVDGEWHVYFSTREQNYVFYVPKNIEGNEGYFNTSVARDDEALALANTFYSVTISNPYEKASQNAAYVFNGDSYSVTLDKSEDYDWISSNAVTWQRIQPDETVQTDTTVTFTYHNIRHPLKITAVGNGDVIYTINYHADSLANNLQKLGVLAPIQQRIEENITINGAATFEETVEENSNLTYRVRRPDSERARVSIPSSSKGKQYYYHFAGWRVSDSDEILPVGGILSWENIEKYEVNGTVDLYAAWSGMDKNTRVSSVNFYVNIACEIADNESNGFEDKPEENYTKSVYTTSIYGTQNVPLGSDGSLTNQFLAPPVEATTAYETDTTIRQMTTKAYNGVTLYDVPSDEDVLSYLRQTNAQILIDGVAVPNERLTTDYFKVRWYVLKYVKDDGWHVDGILVAKEGRLNVRATFSGAEEAVDVMTGSSNDYRIVVTHESTESNGYEEDYELLLKPRAEVTEKNKVGYDEYDSATHTYSWILTGHPARSYRLEERNYTMSGDWQNVNRYLISNAETDAAGWQNYDDAQAVHTRVTSYPNDIANSAIQTVHFQNTYTHAGILTFVKQDGFSRLGMTNVAFTLRRQDGTAVKLYQKQGTVEYSLLPSSVNQGYNGIDGDTIRTDANGRVFLQLPAGSYTLKEQMPEGYEEISKIDLTVDDNGAVTSATAYDADGEAADDVLGGVGTSRLVVNNVAKRLITLTAQKIWDNTPTEEEKPVTVELWYNGVKMTGDEYTQTLSAENGWTYVWHDLPLYIDGSIGRYTLRERAIGEDNYDAAADSDGYRDYAVTYEAIAYRRGEAGTYGDDAVWKDADGNTQYADRALLVVHNAVDKADTSVFVTKQWDDENDSDGLRPDEVTVHLLKNGVRTGISTKLNADNRWSFGFGELRSTENGVACHYRVEEEAVAEYESALTTLDSLTSFLLTNTHTPTLKPSPSVSPSETPSPSPSASPSETPSPSSSVSPSETPSPSVSPSESPSPSPSQTVVPVPGPTPPKTGDGQPNVGRWMLFAALSAAALAAILWIDKRASEKR